MPRRWELEAVRKGGTLDNVGPSVYHETPTGVDSKGEEQHEESYPAQLCLALTQISHTQTPRMMQYIEGRLSS